MHNSASLQTHISHTVSTVDTEQPTNQPTVSPTLQPLNPTDTPTTSGTNEPTNNPSTAPSNYPSSVPSDFPSNVPSNEPSASPTAQPTQLDVEYGITILLEVNDDEGTDTLTLILKNITANLVQDIVNPTCINNVAVHSISDRNNKMLSITVTVCNQEAEDEILIAVQENELLKDKIRENDLDVEIVDISSLNIEVNTTFVPLNIAVSSESMDGFIIAISITIPVCVCCILVFCIIVRYRLKKDTDKFNDTAQTMDHDGTPKSVTMALGLAINLTSMSSASAKDVDCDKNTDLMFDNDEKEVHPPQDVQAAYTQQITTEPEIEIAEPGSPGLIENIPIVTPLESEAGGEIINGNRKEIETWLIGVQLPQYVDNFLNNGYDGLEFVKYIEGIHVLNEIGIGIKKHQQIIFGAIEFLRDRDREDDRNETDVYEITQEIEGTSTCTGEQQQKVTPGMGNDEFVIDGD